MFHFLIESSCFYEKRFEGLRSIHMMFRIAEDARLLMLSEPTNKEFEQSWLDAMEVARKSRQSTIKWRIPDGVMGRITLPPVDSSRSRNSDDEEENNVDDDEQYQKACNAKLSRKDAYRLRRQQEALEKSVADAATLAANRLIIEVRDVPPLDDVDADNYVNRRWCLRDDGKRHMEDIKYNIVLHRHQGTDNDTMYQDEYFNNRISYHQMGIFFCTAYIYGSAIDYFLVSSIRYKSISVHGHDTPIAEIPELVNDHEFALSNSLVTYLPTDFYMSLAGDSTYLRANDYNYQKCKEGGYTNKYVDTQYLRNDIVSVIHRWLKISSV